MIKFNTPDLDGYGFDLAADRVVRFNKHPDGTYLNSRATYSINKKQFTHFDLRSKALQSPSFNKPSKSYKWVIIAIVVLIIVSLSECSFETTIT